MSWHTRIDPELRGSYRGADFFVERSDTTVGRRWLVHEYPRRDVPYTEDMGRRAKEWRLSLFVAGDDYDQQRDKLIKALDAPGAATLVHPYIGTMSAVATDARFSESTREGGVCVFEVTFTESGQQLMPETSIDTQLEVGLAAEILEALTDQDFLDRWSIEGLTGWSLASIERDLASVIDGLEQFIGGIAEDITSVIRFPANIVGMILGGYNQLRNAVMRPVNALDLYSGNSPLSGNGESDSSSRNALNLSTSSQSASGFGRLRLAPGTPVRAVRMLTEASASGYAVDIPPMDTPENIQRANNIVAAAQLNGRLAAVTAARVVAETDWVSRQDADAAGTDALNLIDQQIQTVEPINDDVFNALIVLRAALSTDLRSRALALPNISTYTPQVTLPAVVIAHRLYGDATRADEICVRNSVRHPGALRGGMVLEVLSD
ncbi:DNA circularization protein [Pseudomonas segetis]|uniref:Mu-like prophage DNA circulation protein n=1 Tax=Pseudomonas segetis TaxID=298908 RepID=A0A239JPN4_9PSED|nr:DNA circularization N-terminal domain-containing protein [Pseudomonas segetis]SNT07841.1 Mu-like prophage DNA circulation protein [Pseudomonas segetis]